MSRADGGPAFPYIYSDGESQIEEGMTLRDYFAAKALQGMLSHPITDWGTDLVHKPKLAYQYADAMLQARGAAP